MPRHASDSENPHDDTLDASASDLTTVETGTPGVGGVVGIGASAGGLEALEALFDHLPTDTGWAFVVLQHLSSDFRSHMDELLRRRTRMTVRVISDGQRLTPDTVFVLPPRKEVVLVGDHLQLIDKITSGGPSLPIDRFFHSLATAPLPHRAAVVLSGTGRDGTLGVQSLAPTGALVLCQDRHSARFDGMPDSAYATGAADLALPPSRIAQCLAVYASSGSKDEAIRVVEAIEARDGPAPDEGASDPRSLGESVEALGGEGLSAEALRRLFALLHRHSGIEFDQYKPTTVGRRLRRRMTRGGMTDLQFYLDELRRNPAELDALQHDLLIGVTEFFRDPQAFDVIARQVIAPLVHARDAEDPIRIWVAGCASGQEAYSVAILMAEAFQAADRRPEFKIFATDVHRPALRRASLGIYRDDEIVGLGPERLERFFTPLEDRAGHQIVPALREQIVFAPHNLTTDPPFPQIDLVICRNLLIYLKDATQQQILDRFLYALRPGGILWLGPSESPGKRAPAFTAIDKHWKIFRNHGRDSILSASRMLLPRNLPPPAPTPPTTSPPRRDLRTLIRSYDTLLDRYMPPALLVAEDGTLLQVFGSADELVRVPRGRLGLSVEDLVVQPLRSPIRIALHQARLNQAPVRYGRLFVDQTLVDLAVEPLPHPDLATIHYLVRLDTNPASHSSSATPHASVPSVGDAPAPSPTAGSDPPGTALPETPEEALRHAQYLEAELQYTRQRLQASVEALEAANEELQSTNEELTSSNEELHSVNEELHSVNAETLRRNDELIELTNDMENLLTATDVGVLFLDASLHVRRFTPRIAATFGLSERDLGHSVRSLASTFEGVDLERVSRTVLAGGEPHSSEVHDHQGRPSLLQVLPYQAGGNVAGVVITLVDVSALRRTEAALELRTRAIDAAINGIIVVDALADDMPVVYANAGFTTLTGYAPHEVLGRNCRFLQGPETNREQVQQIRQAIRDGRPSRTLLLNYRKDGSTFYNDLQITPLRDETGRVTHLVGIQHDVTDLIEARAAQRRSEERLSHSESMVGRVLESITDAFFSLNPVGQMVYANPAARELFLRPGETHEGRSLEQIFPPRVARRLREPLAVTFESQQPTRFELQYEELNRWFEVRCFPAEDALSVFLTDTTARKQAEDYLRAARRAAEDANRAKTDFLANMSHEIRTPMTAILGFSDVALRQIAEGTPVDAEHLMTIKRNGQYLLRIINDILDLSRIEAGKFQVEISRFSLPRLIHDIDDLLRMRVAQSSVSFKIGLRGRIPRTIRTDRSRLQQILVNLLTNAVKFTPAGSVDLEIAFDTSEEEPRLIFRVIDTGIGISPEKLDRLFRPFSQAHDQGMGQRFGGTGLGLSISRRLARLLGGDISAESEEGSGSQFTLVLPLSFVDTEFVTRVDEDPKAADQPRQPTRLPDIQGRVLIADDQRDVWRITQHFLQKAGAEVRIAENGKQAVELVRAAGDGEPPFDLVLMDMHMPVMNGYQAVRILRGMGYQMPIVALTAAAMKTELEQALDAGCNETMTKPINAVNLVRKVAELIDQSRNQSRAEG